MAGGGYGRGAGIPLKDRVRVGQGSADSATPATSAPEHPGRHCWVSVPVNELLDDLADVAPPVPLGEGLADLEAVLRRQARQQL